MSEHKEHKIRNRAYELWESEGKEAGRDMDFWLRAEREILGEHPDIDVPIGLTEMPPEKPAAKRKAAPKKTTTKTKASGTATKKTTPRAKAPAKSKIKDPVKPPSVID